jgi:hypothetical protein
MSLNQDKHQQSGAAYQDKKCGAERHDEEVSMVGHVGG